ncbi:hypothetical protein DPMN_123549 [Dreissena polymorpha]|uniref:Uncharacterized protein n=1 Tax=Dreissena polymorpha TaxID=45954 RepID=A0A9D4JRM5_DREPO|nr:hypothetical protein DPMN_123549 [Dreissena polymorpha]
MPTKHVCVRVCIRVYLQVPLASSRGLCSPTCPSDLAGEKDKETAPGSLYKATPSMFMEPLGPLRETAPGPSRVSPTLVVSLSHRPVPLQTGPLAGPSQRALDNKQRVTSPLHLGEDSNHSSVEDVPSIRKYVQVRKSSAE